MKKLFLFLILTILISCSNEADIKKQEDFLIFGHFYGMCSGESCIETFKLTDTALFEDIIDDYNGEKMNFVKLDHYKFKKVKDLIDFFPQQLLNQDKTTIGCPDCADGGGVYIQYSKNGQTQRWRVDQSKSNIPPIYNTLSKK